MGYCDIYLNRPVIEDNKITYSWQKNALLKGESFWIEYPDSVALEDSSYEVFAPYLPVCIAFAAFGSVRMHLPVYLDETAMAGWIAFIRSIAEAVYVRPFSLEFVNGSVNMERHFWDGRNTALLFGGGTESLLCLARLNEDDVKPVLVGFCGPNWEGSNEEENPYKFELQEKAAADLGLSSIRIRTSFREVFRSHDDLWKPLLRDGAYNIVATALFASFTFTFLFPLAPRLSLVRLVAGNEKDNNVGKFFYSFSGDAVAGLKGMHSSIYYDNYLNDIYKIEVARELFTKYRRYLNYQYSCIANQKQRWCLGCPRCLCSYLYYKMFNVPVQIGGFDEAEVARHMRNLIWRCRFDLFSDDPGVPLDYANIRHEAERSGNQEAIAIIRSIYKNLWWTRFLNFFRRMALFQKLKKPLKKVFFLLQGADLP